MNKIIRIPLPISLKVISKEEAREIDLDRFICIYIPVEEIEYTEEEKEKEEEGLLS